MCLVWPKWASIRTYQGTCNCAALHHAFSDMQYNSKSMWEPNGHHIFHQNDLLVV